MMALAVDVSRHGAADGDVARARHDERKESARQEHIDDLRDGDAGLAAQHGAVRIERQHPIEALNVDDAAVLVERGVTVGAARAARD